MVLSDPVTVSGVAAELYALPPADFIGARDARVTAARDAGDPELAAQLKALRRPTVSAALVNALVRASVPEVQGFLDLASSLRQAQEAGDGARLRELMQARQRLTTALERRTTQLAADRGSPMTPAVEREVRETWLATLSDPEAERLVRAGCLTTSLRYSGFGSSPPSPAQPADRAADPAAEKAAAAAAARRRRAAEAKLATAERAAAELTRRLTEAEATVADLSDQLAAAHDRVQRLAAEAADAAEA